MLASEEERKPARASGQHDHFALPLVNFSSSEAPLSAESFSILTLVTQLCRSSGVGVPHAPAAPLCHCWRPQGQEKPLVSSNWISYVVSSESIIHFTSFFPEPAYLG